MLNFLFVHIAQVMQVMPNTFSGPLSSVPACMLPELHAVKVLFCAESVGVVTSGHVSKMAVTPFDLQLPKTTAIRKLYGSIFYRTGVIAD